MFHQKKKRTQLPSTETVESMNALVRGEVLSQSRPENTCPSILADTDRLYFETSLKVTDLPEKLQQGMRLQGIPVYQSLENLYSFLENYSS